jgi:hypothetical protein
LSKLQFDFEIIHKIGELKEITYEEILELSKNAPKQMIFDAASNIICLGAFLDNSNISS